MKANIVPVFGTIVLSVGVVTTAMITTLAASAQTPSGTGSATINPTPTVDAGRPAPSFEAGPLVLNATLKLATGIQGNVQTVPDGTKIQIATAAGVCVETALPTNATQLIAASKELRLPPIDVATKSSATRAGVIPGNCPLPGDRFTIVLSFPNGSNIPLLTTIWSAGTANFDLTVPAPQSQSEAIEPSSGTPSRLAFPATGVGDSGRSNDGLVLTLAAALGAVALLIGVRALGRRTV